METGLIKRRKHILSTVFTLLAIAAIQGTAQRVETEPQKVTLVEGEKTSLLCKSGTAIQFCRIQIPGEQVLVLSPEWNSKVAGYSYYGSGLNAGQCGVTIERVSARNHGTVKCFLGMQGSEIQGDIELVVALTPQRPELEILSKPHGGNFQMNDVFRAKCISRDGRPPANITWLIGDEPIRDGLGMPEIIESKVSNTSLWTTSQEIRRNLEASDDGKFLTCQSLHIADRGNENIVKYQFSVKYLPQPLPDIKVYGLTLSTTAFINVTIRANPRPRIEWIVDGITIPQSTQNSRYESYEPIDLGNGEYNVTLSIAGLTLEDTTKDYYLKASNEMGLQDYTVRISSSNTPASSGLEIGAIIGIVVAVGILLIIVLLIVFARATGRWCFGVKTSKPPANSETSDTESAELKTTKFKKLPTFKTLFKKKDTTESEIQIGSKTEGHNDDEQRLASIATDGQNDGHESREDKQLVYAELVLKPSEDKPAPPKHSTEYAEIVHVSKPTATTTDETQPPKDGTTQ